jgi:SAM-dependent methyltransferase
MFSLFMSELSRIDKQILSAAPNEIPKLFRPIPLDAFGKLLLQVPESLSNLRRFLPRMASSDVQHEWTGNHGDALLLQSVAFIEALVAGFRDLTGRVIEGAKVLDYGCGWGRLLRLLYKYVPCDRLYGVDPWDQSIARCRECGLRCHVAQSDYVPRSLPFRERFDLIFAFSVFTHLSEKTAMAVQQTLRESLTDDGVLAITIRPKEYWRVHEHGRLARRMIPLHERTGYAFVPHNLPPIDGEITYGDSSLTLDYIRGRWPRWSIAAVDWNLVDPYQLIVFLRPSAHAADTTDAPLLSGEEPAFRSSTGFLAGIRERLLQATGGARVP